jgi:hypothetical protein
VALCASGELERRQAEGKLKDSGTRYRRLFESAKDGILILDAGTGKITDVNPFLSDLIGYSNEELIGKTLWEIGPFKDIVISKNSFAELQNRGHILKLIRAQKTDVLLMDLDLPKHNIIELLKTTFPEIKTMKFFIFDYLIAIFLELFNLRWENKSFISYRDKIHLPDPTGDFRQWLSDPLRKLSFLNLYRVLMLLKNKHVFPQRMIQ